MLPIASPNALGSLLYTLAKKFLELSDPLGLLGADQVGLD